MTVPSTPDKAHLIRSAVAAMLNFYVFGMLAKACYAVPLTLFNRPPLSLMMSAIWVASLVGAIYTQFRKKRTMLTPGELIMGGRFDRPSSHTGPSDADESALHWVNHFKSGYWAWVGLAILNALALDGIWIGLERGAIIPLPGILVGLALTVAMVGTMGAIGQGKLTGFFGLLLLLVLHYLAKPLWVTGPSAWMIKELEWVKLGVWMGCNGAVFLVLLYIKNPDLFWQYFKPKRHR